MGTDLYEMTKSVSLISRGPNFGIVYR